MSGCRVSRDRFLRRFHDSASGSYSTLALALPSKSLALGNRDRPGDCPQGSFSDAIRDRTLEGLRLLFPIFLKFFGNFSADSRGRCCYASGSAVTFDLFWRPVACLVAYFLFARCARKIRLEGPNLLFANSIARIRDGNARKENVPGSALALERGRSRSAT